ncbi:zinc-ribbon domain-containing protein [Pelagibacteraceae bacterium]|nr:zinc-ribbon domain-containing protein [Pelagibacteraceae bacterium]
MFIQCSDCDYKYIVNSADLKPDGRMVECANCNHRWFQEPLKGEELLFSSVPKTLQDKTNGNEQENQNNENTSSPKEIKNLPSTFVREKKVSILNTFLAIFFLIFLIFLFTVFKSYGANIFVLLSFYINEFFFNLKLIIDDLAKIVFQILN